METIEIIELMLKSSNHNPYKGLLSKKDNLLAAIDLTKFCKQFAGNGQLDEAMSISSEQWDVVISELDGMLLNYNHKKHHQLKTETEYFQAVEKGLKKFELRKNDRYFNVGDMLCLKETVNGVYTGRELHPMEIKYILHGGKYGLDKDYCIICW